MSERKMNPKVKLLAVALLCLMPTGCGTAEELPRGKEIAAVACTADATQNYALYLPSTYSRERRWPIIYCFDPGARGDWPVGLFKAAAEKYGYILVGSNNSRNGPQEPIERAVKAVWNDTQRRFSIDNSRVYSAGHSGGGQVALAFGLILKRPWAGAIVFCASLPRFERPDILPKGLAVFVATGLYDFNYWPSRKISSTMDGLGIANRLEIFSGGHSWPPAAMIGDALAWMELQAMKSELLPRDDGWIAVQFRERLERAREIELNDQAIEAYERYRALTADFRGLCDTAPAETAAARLDRPAQIAKYKKALAAAEKKETEMSARAAATLRAYLDTAEIRERLRLLEELGISALRRQAEKETAEGLGARRLLNYIFAWAAPSAMQAYGRNDLKAARDLYELAVLIEPGRGDLWSSLANVRARLGDRKGAKAAQKKADGEK